MIDHLTLVVSDYQIAKQFFLGALAPLNYELVMELNRDRFPQLPVECTCGLGVAGKPDLWLRPGAPVMPTHVAFRAPNRAAVRAFFDTALALGANDHGAPGVRAHYHPNYYGAFVIGPDGYNIEAVCHDPE